MAKNQKDEFGIGDWIVHSHYGTGQIVRLEKKQISGDKKSYYRIETNDSTFWIPPEQLADEKIRPLSDQSDIRKVFEVLRKPPRKMSSSFSIRKKRIREVRSDNGLMATARLVRDLRARRRRKGPLNHHERRALRSLSARLLQEWAVIRGVKVEEAKHQFNALLQTKRLPDGTRTSNGKKQAEKTSLLSKLIKNDREWANWLEKQKSKGDLQLQK